ncbi:MAG: hypothetical protein ACYSUQ_03670 [Planctomycetota bacterium]
MTALFWLVVLGATFAALLLHPSDRAPVSGWAGSASALLLAETLAVVLCGFVTAQGVIRGRRRARWAHSDAVGPPADAPEWPGFRASCGALSLLLFLLVCYHLGVGFDVHPLGRRVAAILLMAASGGCGMALMFLVDRRWNLDLADIGLAHICLAACCAAVIVLPAEPVALGERYPLIFNAMVIALAATSWLWCWLSCVWQQQLDGGTAWTTAGRLIQPALRASFFSAVTALIVAWLMTIWPRLPAVSTMDHSFGRVAAGVAGHLILLWAVLWSARRTGKSSYIALAVLTAAGLVAFVYARTLPLITSAF